MLRISVEISKLWLAALLLHRNLLMRSALTLILLMLHPLLRKQKSLSHNKNKLKSMSVMHTL